MARVTELYVREDWGFVRFAYLPAVAAGLWMSKWLPFLAVLTLRINPCLVCALVARWWHHLEEFYSAKPLLQITDGGLVYEDGGEAAPYAWDEILGITMHRRNRIPPWRTGGSVEITPPYWLTIAVRDPEFQLEDSGTFSRRDSYAERSRRSDGGEEAEKDVRVIAVWPRQVEGGLFSMMRFARELQSRLKELADRNEIPSLLPAREDKTGAAGPR